MKKFLWIILLFIGLNNVYSIEPQKVWSVTGEDLIANCLKYSQDGKYLFVHTTERNKDGKKFFIRQWDLVEKKVVREMQTKYEFGIMDVSTDNNSIVGTDMKRTEVIDLEKSTKTQIIPKYGDMFTMTIWVSFSSDNSKIFLCEISYKNIQIFDRTTLKFIGEYEFNDLHRISTSFDKKFAGLVHTNDTTFSIIKLDDGQQINKFKIGVSASWAQYASFSFDNKLVAINYDSTGYKDNTEVYEIATGNLLAKTSTNSYYPSTAFTKDNETIAISSYPFAKPTLWNYKTDTKTILNDYNLSGSNLQASPIENALASTTEEKNFIIIDYQNKEILMKDNKNFDNLRQTGNVYISKDSKYLFVAGSIKNKGVIQKRDFLTGNLIDTYILIENPILNMYVSNDEKLISIIDSYYTVYLAKLVNDKYVIEKQFPHETGRPVESVITSDNKKVIYAVYNTGIVYYNVETDERKVLNVNDLRIKSIALNDDNSKIIYGNYDSYVGILEYDQEKDEYSRVYYAQLEKQLSGNTGISEVGFSPDNSLIYACAGDYRTYIIKSDDYTKQTSCKSDKGWRCSEVSTASINSDNSRLVVFDSQPSGRIFDLADNSEIWYDDSLATHYKLNPAYVSSVKLSPDDKYFAFSFYDGSVAVVAMNDTATSVEDQMSFEAISIYPNPAKDFIEIKLSNINPMLQHGVGNYSVIQIFNSLGEMVLSESIHPMTSSHRMNIESLPKGIYFVKAGGETAKFLKL